MSNIKIIFIVLGLALTASFLNIRVCPFFNIFNIPCPGCGLTRSLKCIFNFKFIESFKYNILGLPLTILVSFYIISYILKKTKKIDAIMLKYKFIIITIIIIVTIISWIININNGLLY